ncbi:hypothetical protein MD484_g4160, partial [Candolleomyces efflorescens]
MDGKPIAMSYFHGAQGVIVEGGITTINANNYSAGSRSNSSIEKLREHIAAGAMHDSAERCDAPKCHPETRVAVQDEIVSWVLHGNDEQEPKKILWVTGPAGGGKTAIMGSTANTCQKMGLLACGFFFSSFAGSVNRRTKRCLIPTLAYQLLQHDALADVGDRILSSIERDPVIFERQLEVQLERLLLQPLRESRRDAKWPKVIVIDGLDECEGQLHGDLVRSHQEAAHTKEADQTEILTTLLKAANDPSFPFQIIIASRSEPTIQSFFTGPAKHTTRKIFLDEKYNPDTDMLLFLESKFAEIRRRYELPASWPSDDAKQRLVRSASGQFIYVATAMRFIAGSSGPPHELLDQVMSLRHRDVSAKPFAPLDALYTHILNSSPNPLLTTRWLSLIFCTGPLFVHQVSGNPSSARSVQLFLESSPGEASYVFRNLHSLVSIPPNDDQTSPYSLFHKSLADFLKAPSRCGSLYVEDPCGLYCARYLQIWKDKGVATAAPLPPEASAPGKGTFLHQFLQMYISVVFHSPSYKEQDFDSCDVAWWIAMPTSAMSGGSSAELTML